MFELLHEAKGTADDVIVYLTLELRKILARKKKDVEWKLLSVREAFQREVLCKLKSPGG
jgi:hypothetical protein